MSPFMIEVKRTRIPLLHLVTKLLAIVGGVFTILGIMDSMIYKIQKIILKNK
jgi:hypothetical protein